jgi:hypothetical protein
MILKRHEGLMLWKLFTDVIYEWAKEAGTFIPGKPFQSSLILAVKARRLPKVEPG